MGADLLNVPQSKEGRPAKEIYYWIALRLVLGIGNINYKNLINHFQVPENVFKASPAELEQVEGITARAVASIKNFKFDRAVDNELELIEKKAVTVVTLNDAAYPGNLKTIYDPPPFLYVKGSFSKLDDTALAIVGSRNASEYGMTATERISRELAQHGLTIVSGMARGIDSCAHNGALAARGRTIAVLGSGIDVIYPPENRRLYEAIAGHGAVVTEFPLGTKPNAYNFPARNRIISGLSLGVLVVEASLQSGSLITAQLALEQGRDVFAVPGNVHSYKSKGTHKLLKDGARLVENAQDILDEIRVEVSARAVKEEPADETPALSGEQQSVIRLLQENPLHIDEIIAQTGYSSSQLSALLLELELDGLIRQLPGKRFSIT